MRLTRNFSAIWLLLALVAGCSWMPWVDDGGKESESLKPAALVKFDAEVSVRKSWSANVGKGLGRKYLELQPAILADRIYAADGYGRLEAFDRFTGKRLWRIQMKAERSGFFGQLDVMDRTDPSFVTGGVATGAGKVFLGTTNGEVVAFSAAEGEELWRGIVGSEVLAPVAVGDGLVFAQTIDGSLLALEEDSGELRWRFDAQVPVLTLRGTSTPVVDGSTVFTGFANGSLVAIKTEDGEPLWEHRVMLPEGRSELERMVDVDAAPLVRGPLVYTVAYQGNVRAVRRADGNLLWEIPTSGFLDLAEGYSQVYVVDDDDVITAIDQNNAEVVWRSEALWRRDLSAPVAFSNYLAVADSDGYLHILAQSDGRMMGRRKLDGKGVRSAMIYSDGKLYVLGNSGSLQALEIEVR